ncbi:MAG TPA: endonuclease/exonuclease/phosphatase family protein, partial [Burkholderiaceae bacterium]|nr:endonuclease/exonuclease/phosphatase family protein [Burkholderiaceae bacterium]
MLSALALVIGGIAIVATLLSVSRSKVWWVRVWDFPRLQLCVLAFGALVLWMFGTGWLGWPHNLFTLALATVLLSQGARIWRYTPLAPLEVEQSDTTDVSQQLSLVVSNVLQTNRQADLLLSVIRGADPDVVLFCETDDWWVSRLDALAVSHPYAVKH